MGFILFQKKLLNFSLLSIYKHRDLKGYHIRWSGVPSKTLKPFRAIQISQKIQNSSVKKVTREVNRKNVLEDLEENGQAKVLYKNDTRVYFVREQLKIRQTLLNTNYYESVCQEAT